MYLPALSKHPDVEMVACCGRHQGRADAFAELWNIPEVYTDYNALIENADIDALVIATGNDTHYPITMKALAHDLHILCEKPISMDLAEAEEMAAVAEEKGVKTLVPFTYRFMPTNRYLKALIDDGYIGKPYHMAMRYYTGYGREPGYLWRFDKSKAGTGVIGDLGSHFLYLAEWYYGPIKSMTCLTAAHIDRGTADPDGNAYEQLEDSAHFLMEFENGAQGTVHVTCVAHEKTKFGQRHFMEFHGSDGTLYQETDWDALQEVRGAKGPDGTLEVLPIPDEIWRSARRDNVHNTYKDVFREDQLMIGEWIDAIVNDTTPEPSLRDGMRIQQVMDAAVRSAEARKTINI